MANATMTAKQYQTWLKFKSKSLAAACERMKPTPGAMTEMIERIAQFAADAARRRPRA